MSAKLAYPLRLLRADLRSELRYLRDVETHIRNAGLPHHSRKECRCLLYRKRNAEIVAQLQRAIVLLTGKA